MLIVYDLNTRETVSISGIRGPATKDEINRMGLVNLPEGQAEYRIYDPQTINQVWQALDAGDGIELVFDGEMPTGILVIDLPEPEIIEGE